MEKVTKYQNIILEILEKYANAESSENEHIETELVVDKERHHYLLMHVGWDDKTPVYHTIVHIDIRDGKVWLQQDWTDAVLADELVEMGIPQSDIVLGFLAPYKRPHSGFAAA